MKRLGIFAACLLVALGSSNLVMAQPLRLGGELSAGVTAQESGGWELAPEMSLLLKVRAGDYPWRLYADASTRVQQDFGSSSWESDFACERLYLKLYLPLFDLSLGKQEISWGVGQAWSPTDLFGLPEASFARGDGQAVTAAVARIPAGPLDYWSLVIADKGASDEGPGTGELQYGIRRHGNLNGTDWSVLAVKDGEHWVLGADLKGDMGLGWSLETAYFSESQRWEGVVGADYSWLDGKMVGRGEYLYNSAGAEDKGEYDYLALVSGGIRHLAKHYAFGSLTYGVDLFSSIFSSVMANLVDKSTVWTLGGRTQLANSLDVSLSVAHMMGEPGGEFAGGIQSDPFSSMVRPEWVICLGAKYSF